MKWITRSHVHVDRVACPWLIARFIDSDAEFLFVPKSKVLEIAEQEGALSFDTPGAMFHHREDLCTFDVLIRDVIVSVAAFGGAFLWQASPQINFMTAFVFGVIGTLGFAILGRDVHVDAQASARRDDGPPT